MIKSANKNSKT